VMGVCGEKDELVEREKERYWIIWSSWCCVTHLHDVDRCLLWCRVSYYHGHVKHYYTDTDSTALLHSK
jgi:hypothetical protein